MNVNQSLPAPLFFILSLLSVLLLAGYAHADDCQRLHEIDAWNDGLSNLGNQVTQQQWDEALQTAEQLNTICERSPILNYMMGRIYKEKGNDSKSLYYYQRATLFTEEFSVKGKNLEKIWFDRYEAENPEARPEAIAARKQEIEQLRSELQQAQEAALKTSMNEQIDTAKLRSQYAAGLWTGVGFTAVGLALTLAGGAMAFKDEKRTVQTETAGETMKAKFPTDVALYLGLFGGGIALTIAGATMAGFFGYHYANAAPVDNLSIHIAPGSAALSFTF